MGMCGEYVQSVGRGTGFYCAHEKWEALSKIKDEE